MSANRAAFVLVAAIAATAAPAQARQRE